MDKTGTGNKIKLSIGILVSNHKEYIRKVMEALKPLLEAVPSELIVLDTKGDETDGSIAIVREYTDKIYPFTWCNDFSAARNACLSYACGEWFMYQDDDEWFDDVQELIDFFTSGECENYNAGCYYTKDYDVEGNYSMGVASRIIRKTEKTSFIGKIHEVFQGFSAPVKYFKCYTHHMGYVYNTPETQKEKHKRNMSLLQEELEKKGYSPRLCAQMVQQLMTSGETVEEGLRFAETSIQRLKKAGRQEDSCTQWVMAATVRCYAELKNYRGMLDQAKKIRNEYYRSRVAELVIAVEVAKYAYSEKDYIVAIENVDSYLKQREWLNQHPKETNLLMQLDFPTYMEDKYYYGILYIGAVSANCMGDFQQAMKYWTCFPWKKEGFDAKPYWAEMQVTKAGLHKSSRELVKSDIKLTIGMLVSNHVEYIRKAMEALKPLLDAVPSELIVVDTKGEETDGSIDIVREYTDKIYPFTWCNDFSAARNVCMEHASGEWFMYQDDDEWFDNVQEFIDFFVSGECENYQSAYYYTKDYNASGQSSLAIAGRMIRRRENTRFVGKVHETFNEVFLPKKQFQCFTHHMGYVLATQESRKLHQQRNLSILQDEFKEHGYTPRICAQMVQEYLFVDDTAEQGLEFAKKSVVELKQQGLMEDSLSQWILTAMVRYYSTYETYEQTKEQVEAIRSTYKLSQTANAVIAFMILPAAKQNNEIEYFLENVNVYIQNWNWIQNNSEQALAQMQLGFPHYVTENKYYYVLHEAAKVENSRGNFEKAIAYWDRMPWDKEGFNGSCYNEDMQITYAGYREMQERKNEIEALYSVLIEAEPVVKQCLLEGQKKEAEELLAGMQETVIVLGNKLELLLGEDVPEIRILEHCCELLWQCANEKQREKALNFVEEFFCSVNKVKQYRK